MTTPRRPVGEWVDGEWRGVEPERRRKRPGPKPKSRPSLAPTPDSDEGSESFTDAQWDAILEALVPVLGLRGTEAWAERWFPDRLRTL